MLSKHTEILDKKIRRVYNTLLENFIILSQDHFIIAVCQWHMGHLRQTITGRFLLVG